MYSSRFEELRRNRHHGEIRMNDSSTGTWIPSVGAIMIEAVFITATLDSVCVPASELAKQVLHYKI